MAKKQIDRNSCLFVFTASVSLNCCRAYLVTAGADAVASAAFLCFLCFFAGALAGAEASTAGAAAGVAAGAAGVAAKAETANKLATKAEIIDFMSDPIQIKLR